MFNIARVLIYMKRETGCHVFAMRSTETTRIANDDKTMPLISFEISYENHTENSGYLTHN